MRLNSHYPLSTLSSAGCHNNTIHQTAHDHTVATKLVNVTTERLKTERIDKLIPKMLFS